MKKFVCFLLAFLMVIPAACAVSFDDLSVYCAVLAGSELTDGDAREPYIRFIQDDCTITLKVESGEVTAAFIEGKGEKFLAYCAAAVAAFDPEYTNSFGQLLTMYLLSYKGEQMGQTSTGKVFGLNPGEDSIVFTIMK